MCLRMYLPKHILFIAENAGSLPSLNAPQKAKLKQLTVVSMAAASKVRTLPSDSLLHLQHSWAMY